MSSPRSEGDTVAACLHNAHPSEVSAHLEAGRFFWLDVLDPSEETLADLARLLRLHPLTVDDARSFHERPKFEEYEGYVYLVMYGVDPDVASGERLLREIHLIVNGDCVVTLHHGPFAPLDALRKRYSGVALRSEQYLVYKLLDAITESFLPVLERIDEDIDSTEDDVIEDPTESCLQRIFALKRDLVSMRRVVTPMRNMFSRDVERIADLPGMETDDRLYFRDVYDSLIRISDLVDSYRDLLSGATDMYLSTTANRQGQVNKQLTLIATIFLPLTFLTGFFGQNFAFLTGQVETGTWSFWVLGIGLLGVSIGLLVLFLRRRGWW